MGFKWDSVSTMNWIVIKYERKGQKSKFRLPFEVRKIHSFLLSIQNQSRTTLIAREKFIFFSSAMSKVWKGQWNIFIFLWQIMPPVNYVTFEMTAVALCNLILPNHERAWLAKPCDCIVIPKFVFFVFEEVNSKGTDHIFAHKPLIWLIQTHLNFKTWNVWKNRLIELVDSLITYEYLY